MAFTPIYSQAQSEPDHDSIFLTMLRTIRTHFTDLVSQPDVRLFTTNVSDCIFDTYLGALPPEHRQHCTCNTCRQFFRIYGSLVVINPKTGEQIPAIWPASIDPELGGYYTAAINACHLVVSRAIVTGPHVTSEHTWGTPRTGKWDHFTLSPPAHLVYRKPRGSLLSASQVGAEKQQDFLTLTRALTEFPLSLAERACAIISAEALTRADKVAGPANWFLALHQRLAATKNQRLTQKQRIRHNLVWSAVALAPPGFTHIRSTMIGTLLEDLAAGLPLEDIQRRFGNKMSPLKYLRPQAAPDAGNVAQAEKIMAEFGGEAALRRRYARLEEVPKIWEPKPQATPRVKGGIFAGLAASREVPGPAPLKATKGSITWAKFSRDVLPQADQLFILASGQRQNFVSILTAADPSAPPIIRWDHDEARNPFSTYCYVSGSSASSWDLTPGWIPVSAVTTMPEHFANPDKATGVIFLMQGCRDRSAASLCLFPEILKSALHPVRATIEAYSNANQLEGLAEASACGLSFSGSDGPWPLKLSVRSQHLISEYTLDRWE